ncbi:MAG: cation:proton antiporter [Armatimonadetes bacterium]|nr:cation:proton antiporter [Armatimonadota bacterium]
MRSADVFTEIVALCLLAAATGAILLRLRQPLIMGFIVVGTLVGPSGFGWARSLEEVHLLAELGLALLLFVVGLKLDLNLIRSLGPVALAAGTGQVALTVLPGYGLALALGMTVQAAFFIAIALAFSSTIVVVKLLSDKREADSLHGRIAVGILIVQDVIVIAVMILMTGSGPESGLLALIAKTVALLSLLGVMMRWALPRLMDLLARSTELLVLFAIAWALGLALASGMLGLSKEVGAFLAGVSLASTPYRESLGARLVSLRDFLLLFFFVELGISLNLKSMGSGIVAAAALSLFVLVIKPLIVMGIMGLMGYRRRSGFLTGLSLAQVSEFSLILAALGKSLGRIGDREMGMITLIGLITIAVSSHLIACSHELYNRLSPYLRFLERSMTAREQMEDSRAALAKQAEVVLFGLGRYGSALGYELLAQNRAVLGVDFDPQAVKRWNRRGWMAWFGDAEDPEFPAMLGLSKARWIISSVPDAAINRTLIHALRHHGYRGSIAVTSHRSQEVRELKEGGADIVFLPFRNAASEAAEILVVAEEQERRKKMDQLIASLKDHYIICGYGRMGKQIVGDLQKNGMPLVEVESNPEQFPRLVQNNIPFVQGKASEDEILLKAGIERARGLIAVNPTDEENVFIVLTARGLNPNLFIVARSIREENEDKLRRAGADRVMSPYTLGGRRIAAAVLKPRVMDFLELVLHSDSFALDIADIRIAESAPFVGKTLQYCGIREATGVNIIAVRRAGDEIHANPGMDFTLRQGDELIVIGTPRQIEMMEKYVSGSPS